MSLSDSPNKSEQYTMSLSSNSYADSPENALEMLFAQMSTGNVAVTIENSDTGAVEELDDLGDQSAAAQAMLGLSLLVAHKDALTPEHRQGILEHLEDELTKEAPKP